MGRKSILEVITELTGQTPVQYSNELKAICCPWHDDKKPSLVIYESSSSYFCFPCSVGGDVYNFYSRFKGCSYRAAKEAINGNVDTLVEIGEYLDGLNVKDEVDYASELNFSLSKYCRDLMYRKPELVNNVMNYLKDLDKTLTNSVSHVIMEQKIKESREIGK